MSSDGTINHYGAVRLRLNGSGSLNMTLRSLDSVRSVPLVAFTMASSTNTEPTRLCNFTEQRAMLEIGTDAADEIFEISKIIIFIKPVATNYPG